MAPTTRRLTRWPRDLAARPRRAAPGPFPNRARRVCRARFQRPPKNRPVAAFDQAATGRARNGLARGTANRCPLARAEFRWCAPPQGAGLVGLRPGLLRQVVRKVPSSARVVRRLYVTKDGSPTRRPAFPMELHAAPQPSRRKLRQEAFSPVVGVLACRVRAQAGEAVAREMPSRPRLLSGKVGPGVL